MHRETLQRAVVCSLKFRPQTHNEILSHSKLLIECLRLFAEELKWAFHHDQLVVTLCGSLIVLDIQFESNGKVDKVKVSSATDVYNPDPRENEFMTFCLKSSDMDRFKTSLAQLERYDSYTQHYSIDFFNVIKGIQDDLWYVHSQELNFGSSSQVCNLGHGVPEVCVKRIAPTLKFFDGRSTNYVFITIDSGVPMVFMPKNTPYYCIRNENIDFELEPGFTVSQLEIYGSKFIKILQPMDIPLILGPPLQFTLNFDPPVLVPLQFYELKIGGCSVAQKFYCKWTDLLVNGNYCSPGSNATYRMSLACNHLQGALIEKVQFTHFSQILPLLQVILTLNRLLVISCYLMTWLARYSTITQAISLKNFELN